MLPSGNVFPRPTSVDTAQVGEATCQAMAASVMRPCSVVSFGVSNLLTRRAAIECLHACDGHSCLNRPTCAELEC